MPPILSISLFRLGQYIPVFKTVADLGAAAASSLPVSPQARGPNGAREAAWRPSRQQVWLLSSVVILVVVAVALEAFLPRNRSREQPVIRSPHSSQASTEPAVGLPVGEEIRILAGASRKYVDHAGKLWSPDSYFSGGDSVQSAVQHIWRTQDPDHLSQQPSRRLHLQHSL